MKEPKHISEVIKDWIEIYLRVNENSSIVIELKQEDERGL